ncbi:unnamed protein product [Didymodactylos carnosus]|uniref:5'-nucleotidase n=1 Tax=Didymodactylos carnosus TaxID=1234261 RepID=A0A814HGR3_9BILA|nr:unnamed protein product [Didymodactylos carnosus]CAF3779939.1 unnamed protein product [Didymodactylos carnosus]
MNKNTLLLLLSLIAIVLISTAVIGWTYHLWMPKIRTSLVYSDSIIGSSPVLPNDGTYVQWTFLQMNDVYEIMPLNEGKKGGLARVATVRKELLNENPHTYTFVAGDLLSPSALSQATVNGSSLNGIQMIDVMNSIPIDYMTFGNHEFDLKKPDLLKRMAESNFAWISTNVKNLSTNDPFGKAIPYKLITISNINILIIGLTIHDNVGSPPYVTIVNGSLLKTFVNTFLSTLNVKYDVLVAITHLDIAQDIMLAEQVPLFDLIIGGHDHENYHEIRGEYNTPICKADSNAVSVFIHRLAYNVDKKLLRIYSTLIKITPDIPDNEQTKAVIEHWYNIGMDAFAADGFQPKEIVANLPDDVELDGLSSTIRYGPALLTDYICQSFLDMTNATVGVFNVGAIRLDDVLRGTITEYDILRILPYANIVWKLSVPGSIVAEVLTHGRTLIGNGMYLASCGVQSTDNINWFLTSDNKTNISKEPTNFTVATIDYAKTATGLNDPSVELLQTYKLASLGLIQYLKKLYQR